MTTSDQDIFNSEVKAPNNGVLPQNPTPNPASSSEDLLNSIVDESGRKKYNSIEDALKALQHSQTHITTLENETKKTREEIEELRKVASRVTSVEDTVKQLLTRNEDTPANQTPAEVDESKIAELVQRALSERETLSTKQANRNRVVSALSTQFGDKVNDVLTAKAKELGTSLEKLGELADTSPDLVLTLFKGGTTGVPSPTTSSFTLPNTSIPNEVKAPTKSILSGATSKEQEDFMKQVKAAVYKEHGITD